MRILVNKTFAEIALGDAASVERTLQPSDMRAWAAAFGDADPLSGTGESQAAAGIVTAILTSLAGSTLPGPGASIRMASVVMQGALPIGSMMTARLTVREKRVDGGLVVLDGWCTDAAGAIVATAVLEVSAPQTRLERRITDHRLEGLVSRCRDLKPIPTGVVHPWQRRGPGRSLGGRRSGTDPPRAVRPGGRDSADRRRCETGHRPVPDRGDRRG